MNLYSVRDDAAAFFLPLFMAKTDAEAKRMFILSLGEHITYKSDYNLMYIGTFNRDTGELTAETPKTVLAGLSIPADLNRHDEFPTAPQTKKPSTNTPNMEEFS